MTRWNEALHPRDSRGRFAFVGARAGYAVGSRRNSKTAAAGFLAGGVAGMGLGVATKNPAIGIAGTALGALAGNKAARTAKGLGKGAALAFKNGSNQNTVASKKAAQSALAKEQAAKVRDLREARKEYGLGPEYWQERERVNKSHKKQAKRLARYV